MRCLGVIPARSGSKRLPRKNVADFLGQPVITYTIRAALESGVLDRVIVSTEDAKTAEIARRAGAEVIDRPQPLATDTVGVLDVCLHALDEEERQGRAYDVLCCLYATAPLRTAEDIRGTMAPVLAGECDFCAAVCGYDMPPHQALVADGQGGLRYMWPELANLRSQDLPEFLVDNGSTYVARVSALRRERNFLGRDFCGYRMPRLRSADIDVQEDLDLARIIGRELLA